MVGELSTATAFPASIQSALADDGAGILAKLRAVTERIQSGLDSTDKQFLISQLLVRVSLVF